MSALELWRDTEGSARTRVAVDNLFAQHFPSGANTIPAVALAGTGAHTGTGTIATSGDLNTTMTSGSCVVGTAVDRSVTAVVTNGLPGYMFLQLSGDALRKVYDSWKHRPESAHVPLSTSCFSFVDLDAVPAHEVQKRYVKRANYNFRLNSPSTSRTLWLKTIYWSDWNDNFKLTLRDDVILDEPEKSFVGNTSEEFVAHKECTAKLLIESWAIEKGANTSLVARIAKLVDIAADDYPESEIPNAEALTSLFEFFGAQTHLNRPEIGLAANGGLWAQWQRGRTHAVGLEFLRSGNVALASYFPDPKNSLNKGSLSVTMGWRAMADYFSETDALKWLHAA